MRRPDDDDAREESLPAELEVQLDLVAASHRDDPSSAVLSAADAGVLPPEISDPVLAGIAASRWQQAIVRGAADAAGEADLDADASARVLTRIHREAAAVDATMRRTTRRRLVWAAASLTAAAVLVVTTVVVRRDGTPATVETPSVDVAAAPAPVFRIPLDAAPLKLTARALVLRRDAQQASFVDDIAPAFEAYRAGDYPVAAEAFEGLRLRYPASVEVPFYLGVSLLMTGDVDGARAALRDAHAMNDEAFGDDVAWYLAIADERAGDAGAARVALSALCAGTSALATRACSVVSASPEP